MKAELKLILHMIQDKQVCEKFCSLKEIRNNTESEALLNKQYQAQAINHNYCWIHLT